METKSSPAINLVGQSFEIVRVLDAPRELVWQAWTDPERLAQWWGPRGFTNPVCDWDARPGNRLHVVMRAANGTDYPMAGEFREVVAPERLVFTAGALDEAGRMMFELLHTVTFTEKAGRTTVMVRTRVASASAGAERYIGGFEAGMTQSLEKLAGRVEGIAPREIVSDRLVAASRELVYEAFGDPAQLAQWWGPKGFTNTFEEFDLQAGGKWRFVMRGPDGAAYPAENTFLEVVRPGRIVFRHEQAGHNFVMTLTFAAESGRTRVVWRMLFDTVSECEPVRKIITEANEENFDRLDAHLAKRRSGKHQAVH